MKKTKIKNIEAFIWDKYSLNEVFNIVHTNPRVLTVHDSDELKRRIKPELLADLFLHHLNDIVNYPGINLRCISKVDNKNRKVALVTMNLEDDSELNVNLRRLGRNKIDSNYEFYIIWIREQDKEFPDEFKHIPIMSFPVEVEPLEVEELSE